MRNCNMKSKCHQQCKLFWSLVVRCCLSMNLDRFFLSKETKTLPILEFIRVPYPHDFGKAGSRLYRPLYQGGILKFQQLISKTFGPLFTNSFTDWWKQHGFKKGRYLFGGSAATDRHMLLQLWKDVFLAAIKSDPSIRREDVICRMYAFTPLQLRYS